MENETYLKLSEKIDKLIDKLVRKFDGIDRKLQNHEVRIVVLEQRSPDEKKDWKTDLIMLLIRAVVIGGVSIASLVGAGGLLSKFMGQV